MAENRQRPFGLARPALGSPAWRVAILIALAAGLAFSASVSHGSGCVLWNHLIMPDFSLAESYIVFPGSNFINGRVTAYKDSGCSDPHDLAPSFSPGGAAYASDRDGAYAICEANNSKVIESLHHPGSQTTVWRCMLGEEDKPSQPSDKPKPRRSWLGVAHNQPDAEAALQACLIYWPSANHVEPHHQQANGWHCWSVWKSGGGQSGGAAPELPLTNLGIQAADGLQSGIEFKRVSHYAVGIQSVIDMGFLDAVDVWSNIGGGYQVCFPLIGKIVFLDAATAPRTVAEVDYSQSEGETCAVLDRAGTVVLVQGPVIEATSTPKPTPSIVPGTNDSLDSARGLDGCQVTPTTTLRFRQSPWGKRLSAIPGGETVPAIGRTPSWYNVRYNGMEGWIAAWLSDSEGGCDWKDGES